MTLLSLQSLFGLAAFTAIAWGLSEDRRAFSWRLAGVAIALQITLAFVLVKLPPVAEALMGLNSVVDALMGATREGTSFVFGYLGGGPAPFEVTRPSNGLILAFQALPLVLVMSALSALLWHWRVLMWVTKGLSFLLRRSLGLSGSVGLATAGNLFVSMVEAPLLIRPYLATMSRSDLFAVMTVGLSTVSGTVLVLYASIVEPVVPGALGQILTASLISLPAAIMMAKIMVPEAANAQAEEGEPVLGDLGYHSAIDAITRGTTDGLQLLLNIIAMLVVIVALVALANLLLGLLPPVGAEALSLQRLLGWLFAPLVWLMGVPVEEAQLAGQLMGTKTILNEFIAYLDFAALGPDALSPRSDRIMLYALCGFANLGSVGIMIGGLATMAPARRDDIVAMVMRALVGGTLATSMTGAVIGLIY